MSFMRLTGAGILDLIVVAGIYMLGIAQYWYGQPQDPGMPLPSAV